jgi:hypothetical protein
VFTLKQTENEMAHIHFWLNEEIATNKKKKADV